MLTRIGFRAGCTCNLVIRRIATIIVSPPWEAIVIRTGDIAINSRCFKQSTFMSEQVVVAVESARAFVKTGRGWVDVVGYAAERPRCVGLGAYKSSRRAALTFS